MSFEQEKEETITRLITAGEHKQVVEVGVYQGKFSKVLCSLCDTLYMVDPWSEPHHNQIIDGDLYINSRRRAKKRYKSQVRLDDMFNKVVMSASDNSVIMRKTSLQAAATFNVESVDFVFLDGSHFYEDVKQDIEAWYFIVRKGVYYLVMTIEMICFLV